MARKSALRPIAGRSRGPAEHDPDDAEPGSDDHGDREDEAEQLDVVMDAQLGGREKGGVAQA
jgi:hypothetical protein